MQQVLLFLLMFWVHILQDNLLKYFFQDHKNLAVCSLSVSHSAHNSLSAWTDDFIFSHNLLCLPHLQNGVTNSEVYICALLIFTLQVKGLFSGNYKKNIKKIKIKKFLLKHKKSPRKILSFRSFEWFINQLSLKKFIWLPYHLSVAIWGRYL